MGRFVVITFQYQHTLEFIYSSDSKKIDKYWQICVFINDDTSYFLFLSEVHNGLYLIYHAFFFVPNKSKKKKKTKINK